MDTHDIKAEDDAKAMPPPPFPRPILLEPEIESLKRCLQNATVKTGQTYGFYTDARRLGIAKHANYPPRTLTSSLGRELEKYDQLCDTIEGHLLRAIAVLQRDLRRAEQKAEAIRLEAQKQSVAAIQATQPSDDIQFAEPAPPNSTDFIATNPRNSPTHIGTATVNSRRPSAISISSLQRPSIPLKLDLSSSSLRMTAEEASGMYGSGLASPVLLAPKSARQIGPSEFPDELMAAFTTPVDNRTVIDLTLAENDHNHKVKNGIDPTAGSSSSKPIELDLDMDMNDLFGDNPETSDSTSLSASVDNMFSMTSAEGNTLPENDSTKTTKEADFIDLTAQDIFASLSTNSMNTTPNIKNSDSAVPIEAPSPATLLAAGFPHHLNTPNSSEHGSGLPGTDQTFDMGALGDLGDLNSVFNSTLDFPIPDMDTFLGMGSSGSGVGGNEGSEKATS